MLLERLKPFQVDPNRVDRLEIVTLVNKISNSSKVSEVQQLFDSNISLCAYFFKNGYIDYQKIYFLSTMKPIVPIIFVVVTIKDMVWLGM
jgi:hypothetical protein